MTNFDAARRNLIIGFHRRPISFVVHFVGCRIRRRPAIDDVRKLLIIAEISVCARDGQIEIGLIAIDLTFACFSKNDEFVRKITANWASISAHRDRLQTNAGERAQIRHEHAVVSHLRALVIEVERIGIFHQEFTRAHHAETRTHFIAELPLNMVEVERQVFVRAHIRTENIRDHFLISRSEEHFALLTVLNA